MLLLARRYTRQPVPEWDGPSGSKSATERRPRPETAATSGHPRLEKSDFALGPWRDSACQSKCDTAAGFDCAGKSIVYAQLWSDFCAVKPNVAFATVFPAPAKVAARVTLR